MKINFRSTFLKSITILASGSVFAQLITLASAPFITRLFTPEDIGIYTYVLAFSHLFMAVINGRYDMSIVTEEKEEHVFSLIKLSFLICIGASILISIGIALYFRFFSETYASYTYTAVFLLVLLISYGVINILTSYNNRHKEYKLMSSTYVIRTGCQNIGAIVCGIFKTGMLGLLFPYTVGQLMGINRQAKSLKPHLKEVKNVTRKQLLEVSKLHYKQPLFSAPALFANSFSYSSLTFFIEALFGMGVVGFYSISVRVLGLPLSVISGNVSRVFFEEASREYDQTGQFYKAFRKTTLFLVALAIPMILCMIFIAPPLSGLLFGKGWEEAGIYIKVLATMFGIRFIVTSLSPGLLVAKKQNYELMLQVLFIISSVTCYILAKIRAFTVVEFLTTINISFSMAFIIYFVVILKCSKNKKGAKENVEN